MWPKKKEVGSEEKPNEKLNEKLQQAKNKAVEKFKDVDKFVKEKPYKAIGIVAGTSAFLGAIAGFFLRRKKK